MSTISWNALKRWWTHFSLLRNNQCCNCKEFFTLNILLQKYFKSIFGSRVLDYSLTFLISSFSDRPGGGGSSRSHYINSNQGIPPMLIVTIHFLKQKKMDLGQMVRYLRWTLEKKYIHWIGRVPAGRLLLMVFTYMYQARSIGGGAGLPVFFSQQLIF